MTVGDLVFLKNDSAKLVVKAINPDTSVQVYAHDPNGFQVVQTYPAACLRTTDPNAPAAAPAAPAAPATGA